MTLGKPGVAGDAPGLFNTPSDVVTAPNGDIFVADGHGILLGQPTQRSDRQTVEGWQVHQGLRQARFRPRRVRRPA
jgi:hypothetical protein